MVPPFTRRAGRAAALAATAAWAACSVPPATGGLGLALKGDPALLARIQSYQLQVWDGGASCSGASLVPGGGSEILAPQTFPASGAIVVDVSPGMRTFFLLGYADSGATQLIASGCASANLASGRAVTIPISMVATAGPEAGPTDMSLVDRNFAVDFSTREAPRPDARVLPDAHPGDTLRLSDTLRRREAGGPPPPSNDTCASPLPVTISGGSATVPGTLVGANDDSSGSCGGAGYPDVVYTIALSSTSEVSVSVTPTGGAFTPVVYIQSSCGVASSELSDGCAGGALCPAETLTTPSVMGPGVYYVWVDSAGGTPAPFTLSITTTAPPVTPTNETCATAATIITGTCGYNYGDTTASLNTYHPVCAKPSDSRDVAYKFTLASSSAIVLDRQDYNGGWDGVTDLRPLASCTTDSASLGCTAGEFLACPSLLAGSYAVIVDGICGATGQFNLLLSTAAATAGPYIRTAPNVSFLEVSGMTTATELYTPPASGLSSGWTGSTTLPFDLVYFGKTYSAGSPVYLSQSGFLSFEPITSNPTTNAALPSTLVPADTIAPFWGRLASVGGTSPHGSIWSYVAGTAPDRTWIVEWNGMDGETSTGADERVDVSFEIEMIEGSNAVMLNFPGYSSWDIGGTTPDSGFAIGGNQTIGMQGSSQTVAISYDTTMPGWSCTAPCRTCTEGFCSSALGVTPGWLLVPPTPGCP